MSLWAIYLYITKIGPHFSCSRICRSIVGIYKSLTRQMNVEIPLLGIIFVSIFGYWFFVVLNKNKGKTTCFSTHNSPCQIEYEYLTCFTEEDTDYDRGSHWRCVRRREKGIRSQIRRQQKKCGPLLIYIFPLRHGRTDGWRYVQVIDTAHQKGGGGEEEGYRSSLVYQSWRHFLFTCFSPPPPRHPHIYAASFHIFQSTRKYIFAFWNILKSQSARTVQYNCMIVCSYAVLFMNNCTIAVPLCLSTIWTCFVKWFIFVCRKLFIFSQA